MTYLYLEDKEKNEIFFVHSRFTLFRNVWKRGTMGTMGRMGLQPLKSLQSRDVNDSVTLRKMYVFVRYVTIIRNVYMYF